jgi:hypothetical protein
VKVFGEQIIALIMKRDSLSLTLLNKDLEVKYEIATLKGFQGFILDAHKDTYLLAVDDQLLALRHGNFEPILKAHSSTNFYWHAIRRRDVIYVQEYGEGPTGIWMLTKDYEDRRLLTTNIQLDEASKHFHNLAFDPFRNWLITTLGDNNVIRVVASMDEGETWWPLYKGPWQFVPIVTLKDRIIFGMDSGIAKGGIGVYDPSDDFWSFIFLRWQDSDENVRFAQICDLKHLSNALWVAALGAPQAITLSKDLKIWYLAHIEGVEEGFNYHMTVSEGKDFVVCCTGKRLLLFKKSELEGLLLKNQPVMVSYRAYIDRLRGYRFVLKRKLLRTSHIH